MRKTTKFGIPRVSIEPCEETPVTLITPNWCDKRTWYYSATKQTAVQLTDSGNHTSYSGSGVWVDNLHGLYSDEDTLLTSGGEVARCKVYVNGVQKTEADPHTGQGDFTVNYNTATVTFNTPLAAEDVVTATYWLASSSEWIMRPDSGKKLKIKSVEAQFSVDVSVTDSILFTTYGYVDVFAPQLVGNPYASGTKIPIAQKVYKTMMDFINEANGALPLVYKTTASPTWRDLGNDVQTFPWNYQAMKILYSSAGMETRIALAHNTPFIGSVATASFYCYSDSE